MQYEAIEDAITIRRADKEVECKLCGDKIKKKRDKYMIMFPVERHFRNIKRVEVFHVRCFIKLIKNPDGFRISRTPTEVTCDICNEKIKKSERGVRMRGTSTIFAHETCLIASIYKLMSIKVPPEMIDELLTRAI